MRQGYIENDLLIQAARVAYLFKQSVIDVLRSPAEEWLMWSAAYEVISEDKRKEAEQMKARAKK